VYNYTCCVSGLKITALFDAQFVDACHIVPFSKSGNDTVSNGISLSPNLHRAFDRGLFTVDENYRVVVSDVFSETGNADYGLKQFHGKQIVLPEDALFYPDVRNFGWHRENVFRV
jgi:putative restriction endonuclease